MCIWCVLVTQSCPTLCNPMDCSPPGSSVHEIFQARILEWVAISFSRGSSQPRDRTWVSCTVGRFFTDWVTREAPFVDMANYSRYSSKMDVDMISDSSRKSYPLAENCMQCETSLSFETPSLHSADGKRSWERLSNFPRTKSPWETEQEAELCSLALMSFV